MDINFIIIYDNTAEAKVKFASESITEVLGYDNTDLLETWGYENTHPDEREALGITHISNVTNEHLSTITTYRSRHKEGHYVLVDLLIQYCYDTLVCTCYPVTSPDSLKRKIRLHSVDRTFSVQPDGTLFVNGIAKDAREMLKKQLSNKIPWGENQAVKLPQEPRFCLIMNRFTEKATIVFATQVCERVTQTNPYELIGESFYDYVATYDRPIVYKQIDLSKSKDFITRLRFDWRVNENIYIPLEAMISSTHDGIVLVGRLAPSLNSR